MKIYDPNKKILKEKAKCDRYFPCPICYRCMEHSRHRKICENCKAGPCKHTDKQRALIIKRENFRLNVSQEVKNIIKDMEKEVLDEEEAD